MQPPFNSNPTKVVSGERIGKQGMLRLGCSALLFNKTRKKILLTRRADNGMWCLPGGMINPGETVAEGCEREVFEETGLSVSVKRLSGVYSNPNRLTIYPDGNKAAVFVLVFEVEKVGGQLSVSNETTDAKYFPVDTAIKMDLFHGHAEQIRDSLQGIEAALIR